MAGPHVAYRRAPAGTPNAHAASIGPLWEGPGGTRRAEQGGPPPCGIERQVGHGRQRVELQLLNTEGGGIADQSGLQGQRGEQAEQAGALRRGGDCGSLRKAHGQVRDQADELDEHIRHRRHAAAAASPAGAIRGPSPAAERAPPRFVSHSRACGASGVGPSPALGVGRVRGPHVLGIGRGQVSLGHVWCQDRLEDLLPAAALAPRLSLDGCGSDGVHERGGVEGEQA
mmetsp:Transcript_28975/g.92408  ORF Transcript_28975/g.92408 Transcript_28975/m.92408 type:complete len:228 (-) Transcript_28975:276-959(-)|eukprot:scaffold14257_cov79-Isochrysis_galbana.AAC.1